MLTFQNFQKSYGSQLILTIPELTIPPGIHWVKGYNGSGKTTLFKVLAGLIPYQGTILLNGKSLSQNPVQHRQLINFGEAEPLYPEFLTGQELLNLFLKAKKGDLAVTQKFIGLLNAQDFLSKPVGTYSSGMLKKLSLLLAFTGNPTLIILDEPLITLDQETVKAMYAIIQDWVAQREVNFLISSHQDIEMPELVVTATWLVNNQQLIRVPA